MEMNGLKVPGCVESQRWSYKCQNLLPSSEMICSPTRYLNQLLEHIFQGVKGPLCFKSDCQFLKIVRASL